MFVRSVCLIRVNPAVTVQQSRYASTFMRFRTWYRSLFSPKVERPPYKHVCQIGDPVLRQAAQRVPPEEISSQNIQKIISNLHQVMQKYDAISLSAPQIGVPLQIFTMELDKQTLNNFSKELAKILKIKEIPFKVAINPAVQVLDYSQQMLPEMCPSVRGFTADVNRFAALRITAYDENGQQQVWDADGLEARTIQHEMDHLAGLLFTDRMESRSLCCAAWEAVNRNQGNVYIPFWPKKGRGGAAA